MGDGSFVFFCLIFLAVRFRGRDCSFVCFYLFGGNWNI